ncbi:hypothetical protein KM043_014192 [Ampulex compressa]|nr:hypothetical protein KM043_014192 [Ampulex compressa]
MLKLASKRLFQGTYQSVNCLRTFTKEFQEKDYPKQIYSGIQPTGIVHLGNYLGAIQKWVCLQDSGEQVIWSIADLHSITVPQEPKKLQENILNMVAMLIACGIDPKRSILFQQSTVPMHTELCWILGCNTTMARLGHLPQYKEKIKTETTISLGLYIYPVLQAADILLYKATHVPVGQDQVQHIQLAQSLAMTFNKKYGDTFPVPQALINDDLSQRIKSLRDPSKKMSKSSKNKKATLNILDSPDILLMKIKKAVTDFTSEVTYDPEKRPGVANLIIIHSLLTNKTPAVICAESQGLDTGEYKLVLADVVIEKLKSIRERYLQLIKEPAYLEETLKQGTDSAMEIATDCWHTVRNKVGFSNNKLCPHVKNYKNAAHKI